MDVKEIKRKVMELLNKQYEENFIQRLGCDRLIRELDCNEEEFKDAVDLLRAKEWVERLNERVGGHYNLKLTVKGKRKFDEVTCNRRDEQVRQHLLQRGTGLSVWRWKELPGPIA